MGCNTGAPVTLALFLGNVPLKRFRFTKRLIYIEAAISWQMVVSTSGLIGREPARHYALCDALRHTANMTHDYSTHSRRASE